MPDQDPYAAIATPVQAAASDPYAQIAQPIAAPDDRNAVQRGVDWLTTVTPEQEAATKSIPVVGGALNQAAKFGAGAIQGATAPLVHPLQTLEGMGNAIAHPKDAWAAISQGAINNPAQSIGNLIGGAVLGEAAGPAASAISNGLGRVAEATGIPEKMYASALKPSTTLSTAQRAALVKTGLQQGIPVSEGGLKTIAGRIDDLNQAIKAEIATDPTRQISTAPALQNLQGVSNKFATQVAPGEDMSAINRVGREFTAQTPSGSMNAADAQAMKQGTYQALGSKSYGEVKGASIEAQKALARGLKEEIANQFPEINNLNAQESKLLDLEPVLERAIGRTANHQLLGIGTPIAISAAKGVTGSGSAGIVAGVLKGALDNPLVKSRLAISLSKGANIPFAQALARVGAYSSALQSSADAARESPGDQSASK